MDSFSWNAERQPSCPVRHEADVYERWLGFIERHIYRCVAEKGDAEASQIHASSRCVNGFTIARLGSTTAGRFCLRRDARGIARDSRDEYALHLSMRGSVGVSQFGRSQLIAPGSYAFFSASEPVTLSKDGADETILLLMPREFVDQRVVDSQQICVRPTARATGLHRLVFETVSALANNAWQITDSEFQKASLLLSELVLLALTGTADRQSGEPSIRMSSLARVKRIIRQRLSDPDLRPAVVAQEADLSLSYVHELFRTSGDDRTMRGYMKSERLQRARQLMRFPSSPRMTVTEIATQCGFSNMSRFSTSFKSAFGITPRDVMR